MSEDFHPVSNYKVSSEYEGVRLDNCLISKLKGLPRAKIYSIIRKVKGKAFLINTIKPS